MESTTATPDFPEKFWASNQGLIDLQRLGDVPFSIEQIRDRMLIEEAFNRFAMAHDENRVEVVLSCMTDDVAFECSLGSATEFARFDGRDALRAQLSTGIIAMPGQRRHCISNVIVDRLDQSTATAYAYGVVTRADQGLILQATVMYAGELRKEPDGFWRFTRFFIGMDEYADDGAEIPRPEAK